VLALRSIFFALLLPGTVTLLLPYFILSRRAVPHWDAIGLPGLVAILVGRHDLDLVYRGLRAGGTGNARAGRPPEGAGDSRAVPLVRNPMYVGVVLVQVGESALFRSASLLLYAGIFFLIANLFVMLYEEPTLRARFGESYAHYRRSVGRWIPRRVK